MLITNKWKMKYDFLSKIPTDTKKIDYHHKKNIVKCATKIIKHFLDYDEVVTVAEMQSGKTEVMKRLIYLIRTHNDKLRSLNIEIDKYNVYLILCASSINLKEQLKIKLPEIKHKIYHLNDIINFTKNEYENESLFLSMSDSSLIIFDECHCDIECSKTIDKFRTILDSYAKDNNTTYYKVGFSATPYEQVVAGFPKAVMKPGKGYYGIKDMFELNENDKPILFQAKDLTEIDQVEDFFREISIDSWYYIFRLPGKNSSKETVINNIINYLRKNRIKFDSYIYDMNYRSNINDLIKNKPSKPTIIFIKEKLRLGEYLDTKNIYLVHDDPDNGHTHTTAQSLLGRCCGYHKKSHQTVIYCDYEKAWEHYQWIINDYDIDYIPTNAKYIKSNKQTKTNCMY
ncbi:hypothetical protein QJ850_gp373 [Acanthamoeba polyphaga mimivirus]|uniref:Helicase ATP-binding domain-containing protein n=1 Tax=Acanthamoeba polyphaga mimivirus Kroon TaxID=3069720 RepID=A0A0G2YB66_9VIRU|nr:hypothetical protein QJ850_gp373 [Acanthamoeba polyphaga mimivirus]AKI80326.1 hypothetical protein [Acanthamoeba polyphaga mimivirus Kroon]